MLAAFTGLAGKAIGGIFGWLLGNPLILGALLIVAAYNFGYWLGERDGTRDMVSKIELANKEAEIANLKNEKKIAEDAAKQVETDKADLEALAAQQQGEINAYKAELASRGQKCPLSPADRCRIYKLPKGCGGKGKAASDRPTGLAGVLPAVANYSQRRWLCRVGRLRERERAWRQEADLGGQLVRDQDPPAPRQAG